MGNALNGRDLAGGEPAIAQLVEVRRDNLFRPGERLPWKQGQQPTDNCVPGPGVQLLVGNCTHQRLIGIASRMGLVQARADGGDVATPVVVEGRQESGGGQVRVGDHGVLHEGW
ncbi:hypothetical protein D3C84_952800 [compost metagenome]